MKLSEKLAPYLENEDLETLIKQEEMLLDLLKKQGQWVQEYPELKRQADRVPELWEDNETLKKALVVALKGY